MLIVPFTGAEIATQFNFVGFRVVITFVGSDDIEINVRGTTQLDNIVKTQSEVRDVATDCN